MDTTAELTELKDGPHATVAGVRIEQSVNARESAEASLDETPDLGDFMALADLNRRVAHRNFMVTVSHLATVTDVAERQAASLAVEDAALQSEKCNDAYTRISASESSMARAVAAMLQNNFTLADAHADLGAAHLIAAKLPLSEFAAFVPRSRTIQTAINSVGQIDNFMVGIEERVSRKASELEAAAWLYVAKTMQLAADIKAVPGRVQAWVKEKGVSIMDAIREVGAKVWKAARDLLTAGQDKAVSGWQTFERVAVQVELHARATAGMTRTTVDIAKAAFQGAKGIYDQHLVDAQSRVVSPVAIAAMRQRMSGSAAQTEVGREVHVEPEGLHLASTNVQSDQSDAINPAASERDRSAMPRG